MTTLTRTDPSVPPPIEPPHLGRWVRRAAMAIAIVGGIAAIVAVSASIWFRSEIGKSLPALDGEIALAGLSAPVRVDTDSLGVPFLQAATLPDAARATGFLHAQNRFFQMDLQRRQAAGELSALLGRGLLEADRRLRIHRFRDIARRVIAGAPEEERSLVEAYTAGVNAGLAALGSKPFEYVLFRSEPEPWLPEDSALALLTMFIELHDEDGSRESALGVLHDVLPQPLFDFLAPAGTEWDAPVEGGPLPDPPLPGPEIFDLRAVKPAPAAERPRAALLPDPDAAAVMGSNNWAVAGSHTAHGGALLANDMHLGHSMPNIWYRVSVSWGGGPGGGSAHRITGVTLPGTPAIVTGSNGRIAWGYTNSQGDWTDVVIVETDPADPNRYLTPEGPKPFEHHAETIRIAGEGEETLDILSTIWGPVLGKDHRGRPKALRWTAYDGRGVNFSILRMAEAGSIDEALDAAARSGIPPQNCVIADAAGRIAWTIMGAMPNRVGFDGHLPASWADGARRWDGWLEPEEHPRIVDPASGRIWTANARVVEGEMLRRLGDGGYDLGARARQIRDDLMAIERATERDMLKVQLDDRAIFLERWRDLLLRALDEKTTGADPRRREFRKVVETNWTGRASVDSAGYRLVRAFRGFVAERTFASFDAIGRQADPNFRFGEIPQEEGPLWRLVTEKPAHLLDPNFKTWDDLFLASVDAALAYYAGSGSALADRTWGERNTVRIQHPISLAIPWAGRWLDIPAEPLPGDDNMPRVQGPGFGASERMVVSPGREDQGIFHMPGGQSGHPLSPYYREGHRKWARGEPSPFLPGPAAHTLTLRPAR